MGHKGNLKQIGKLLYISGQISIDAEGNLIKGKLGKEISTEEGYEAAVRCALSIVSQAKTSIDDLSKIKSCIKLTGYVNSVDDFIEQPKVINGASDTIVKYSVILGCILEQLLVLIAYL